MPLLVSDGNIELQKRTWPQDDKVVTSIELKITKWTLIKPFCRFNTVVLVIIIYVSIVTAIFILFLKHADVQGMEQGMKKAMPES